MRHAATKGCKAPKWKNVSGDLLRRIVQDYLAKRAENEERYLRFYAMQPTLEAAICKAAMAELPSGKRFPHQRRIPRAVLERARDVLLGLSYEAVRDFDELFQLCSTALQPIPGVGELTIYDTVHRLGAFFGFHPVHVYLHAGVRVGAMALGLGHGQDKIGVGELPRALQVLRADQVEDCLCIYKKELQAWATQLKV